MKRITFALLIYSVLCLTARNAFSHCGVCGIGDKVKGEEKMKNNVFHQTAMAVKEKDGVKEISYEEFMKIRESGEEYVFLDVLSSDSYESGHIEGAKSFPLGDINKASASAILSKESHIIVYCGSFACGASTNAAKKLIQLGYTDVLDYKGGLKEWQEKGNKLVR